MVKKSTDQLVERLVFARLVARRIASYVSLRFGPLLARLEALRAVRVTRQAVFRAEGLGGGLVAPRVAIAGRRVAATITVLAQLILFLLFVIIIVNRSGLLEGLLGHRLAASEGQVRRGHRSGQRGVVGRLI